MPDSLRADVLSLKERDFVTASRSVGAGPASGSCASTCCPNLLNTIVIVMTLEIAIVILAEAALSFLGVGVGLGTSVLGGRMITDGRDLHEPAPGG